MRDVLAIFLTNGMFRSCLHYFMEQDVTFLFVVFRKDTRPAITKAPASCRSHSNPMRRSMAIWMNGGILNDRSILKRIPHISENPLVEWGDTSVSGTYSEISSEIRICSEIYSEKYLRNIYRDVSDLFLYC